MSGPLRIGFLYPFHGAEDEYPWMASLVDPAVEAVVASTPIVEDAHRLDALRAAGAIERIASGARPLQSARVKAAMWACTSGSFVFGLCGAEEQTRALERELAVPVSSTSFAFIEAAKALDLKRVAVAATYPKDVTALFVDFLQQAGLAVVSASHAGILSALEVAKLGLDELVELMQAANDDAAEAILLPDTALHTARWLPQLEMIFGRPVLTANQVTFWQALRLARETRVDGALGSLFTIDDAASELVAARGGVTPRPG
jgi:maleate cis-trans isomerase